MFFLELYILRVLCSQGTIFPVAYFSIPGSYVPSPLSSLSSIFPSAYIFMVPCSQVPIFSTLCFQSYMFSGPYISRILYFHPKSLCSQCSLLTGLYFSIYFQHPIFPENFPMVSVCYLVIVLVSYMLSWPYILTSLCFHDPESYIFRVLCSQ